MLYPCYFYEEGMQLPETGTYFVVAGNGNWMHKDTGIVKAFLPVDNISILQDLEVKPWVRCDLPKLPAVYVNQIKAFFQVVAERYKTEAIVILYYNKQDQSYKIVVPDQRVTHGSVIYKIDGSCGDYLMVGTIHSHCDFGAFHSGVDIGDEAEFDGLHCTFGHNHESNFTITSSISVNGHRLAIKPTEVLEGIELVDDITYKLTENCSVEQIDEWLQKIHIDCPGIGMFDFKATDISKGDKVVWAGDLKTVPFKDLCGEGPFEVDSVNGGFYTIKTEVGLARFSEKLFRKLEDDQKN